MSVLFSNFGTGEHQYCCFLQHSSLSTHWETKKNNSHSKLKGPTSTLSLSLSLALLSEWWAELQCISPALSCDWSKILIVSPHWAPICTNPEVHVCVYVCVYKDDKFILNCLSSFLDFVNRQCHATFSIVTCGSVMLISCDITGDLTTIA